MIDRLIGHVMSFRLALLLLSAAALADKRLVAHWAYVRKLRYGTHGSACLVRYAP
jgi:hypothetical protein